jgi:GDP-4-dehydro-6-deoxy-D-mannose reductase
MAWLGAWPWTGSAAEWTEGVGGTRRNVTDRAISDGPFREAAMPHEEAPRSALITGAGGFIGQALARYLALAGVAVSSMSRRPLTPDVAGRHLLCPDLADEAQVLALLQRIRPEVVFHLAGSATAGPAQLDAELRGTGALLRAAARLSTPPRVLLTGSAAEYGPLPTGTERAGEATPCHPTTPYGMARLAQTRLGLHAAATGQPLVVARLFNVVGPGMGSHLALGRFAAALAEMRQQAGGVLRTGSLHAVRDMVPLEDVVRVLTGLAVRPAAVGRVVPVCSGVPVRMDRVLELLVAESGLAVHVAIDEAHRGVNAIDRMVGDPAALRSVGITPPSGELRRSIQALWTRVCEGHMPAT